MGKKLALVHSVGRQGYKISLHYFLPRYSAHVLHRHLNVLGVYLVYCTLTKRYSHLKVLHVIWG